MSKKIAALILVALCIPVFTLAQSTAEINAGLEDIIKSLEEIAASLPADTGIFCYDFNSNLRFGATGDGVQALHKALVKEGFQIDDEEKNINKFGDSTASAVTGFQQKYETDVLSPVGLSYGTGSVGSYTRGKLNELYGCEVKSTAMESAPQVLGVSTEAQGGLALVIEIMSQILERLGDLLGR